MAFIGKIKRLIQSFQEIDVARCRYTIHTAPTAKTIVWTNSSTNYYIKVLTKIQEIYLLVDQIRVTGLNFDAEKSELNTGLS